MILMAGKNDPSPTLADIFPVEFHISRRARERYRFDRNLYGLNGNVVISGLENVRQFAQRMNEVRASASPPEPAVRAGEINALGLIDEIFHFLVGHYRKMKNPRVLARAIKVLEKAVGIKSLNNTLLKFIEEFPGSEVYSGHLRPSRYLRSSTRGTPNKQILCEELLLLYLSNQNPAFAPYRELFDDSELARSPAYPDMIRALREFFLGQPPFGPENLPLVDFLMAPIRAAPDSLSGQLDYIRRHWSHLLNEDLLRHLLLGMDVIKEEEKLRGLGPGPILIPDFSGRGPLLPPGPEYDRDYYHGSERFSPDLDWMPRVVLIAKNTAVWLEQLSRRYQRAIFRLDQIPDEELDHLSRCGFTALWLIGLWERSSASWKIKQGCGNPEAAASAYSIYDYIIAADLGGEAAFSNLKSRTLRRGIRLAGDMVPNHTGIYSRWVREHPGRFIQASEPPFPGYRFTGRDLSDDPRIGIIIEDGYWTRQDAAVVFKRVDRQSGEVRYLYHGNDGTNMPWNDTAQLDFVRPEVREAVIRTILDVARKFSIIRFDAAMVLTKKHFQRLWYPPPGSGGDIPSRAGRGMSPEAFNRLFPREFWREVVDRVAAEGGDTLLLAEAFWLLEGYFVRTLGMHRVYNSAFMNMLKMEMNANYRQVMKNILEFDPRILKRLVNFMSNPDEATAVAQFGRGDKYFGVCTLMVTLPGLPLFGHGQVEGMEERYGMEYRRAYWNEPIDQFLVKRHEKEIFPLMKKRHLFSDVAHFQLYDFFRSDGRVNEDVFAYSNRYESERALVVYHNRFAETAGWIRTSVARAEAGEGGGGKLLQVDLAGGLGLRADSDDFCIFKDQRTGLEYIRPGREIKEKGLYLKLGAYGAQVFTDFRELKDDQKKFLAQLTRSLRGKGTPDIEGALKKVHFAPLHRAFRAVFKAETARKLFRLPLECSSLAELDKRVAELILPGLKKFLREVVKLGLKGIKPESAARRQLKTLKAILLLMPAAKLPRWTSSRYSRPALRHLLSAVPERPDEQLSCFRILFTWAVLRELRVRVGGGEGETGWLNRWFLGELLIEFIRGLGGEENAARRELDLITILLRHDSQMEGVRTKRHLHLLEPVFKDSEVRRYLRFNWFADNLWFQRESLEELLFWLLTAATISRATGLWDEKESPRLKGMVQYRAVSKLRELAASSGYRVKEFRLLLLQTKSGIGPS